MSRFSFFIPSLLLLLAACSSTVTQSPNVTRAELQSEQKAQEAILQKERTKSGNSATNYNRQQLEQRLQRVGNRVTKAGTHICQKRGLSNGKCSFPIALDANDAPVNAYTDGQKIVVAPAMLEFANDDNQLATVLSHEYAHAIMAHPQKTTKNVAIGGLLGVAVDSLAGSQGLNTGGLFSKLGSQGAVMRYSQDFEKEADYVGVYILQRAGYNIHNAPYLWRRMATLNPDGIYNASTHPTTAERYLILSKTSQEIVNKQSKGEALLPQLQPDDKKSGFFDRF